MSPRHVLLLGLLLAGGCYRPITAPEARPTAPASQRESMVWIDGLAPADPVETAASCPNGAVLVETHHSVLDVVANVLTLGLYTPMTIAVTCGTTDAAGLPTVHGSSDVAASVAEAAALAYTSDTTVLLELPR